MTKCPKCKKEINYLKHYESGETHYTFELDDNKKADYETVEFQPDNKVTDYECPECSEVLFTNEDKAVKFLRGKKK